MHSRNQFTSYEDYIQYLRIYYLGQIMARQSIKSMTWDQGDETFKDISSNVVKEIDLAIELVAPIEEHEIPEHIDLEDLPDALALDQPPVKASLYAVNIAVKSKSLAVMSDWITSTNSTISGEFLKEALMEQACRSYIQYCPLELRFMDESKILVGPIANKGVELELKWPYFIELLEQKLKMYDIT